MFYIKLKLQCKLSVDTIFRQNMIMFLTSYDSNLVAILYKWANHYHVFMVRESCFFFFSVELCCRNYISFVCLISHEQELIECQLYVSFFLINKWILYVDKFYDVYWYYLKVSFFPFRIKEGLDGISFIGKGKVAEVIQNNDTCTYHKEEWGFSHLMTACIINFIAHCPDNAYHNRDVFMV